MSDHVNAAGITNMPGYSARKILIVYQAHKHSAVKTLQKVLFIILTIVVLAT